MTLQELLQRETHLRTDEAKTGVYLIPSGKKGYTSFPVGQDVATATTKKRVLPEGYVFPEGITAEEKAKIENEEFTDYKFVLDEKAVLISADDYQNLQNGTHVWSNGKIVLYTKPQNVIDAENLILESNANQIKRDVAQTWLDKHDYIGNKMAQTQVFGTPEQVAALKLEYASEYAESEVQRGIINTCDAWATNNAQALKLAQEVLNNENK